MRRSSFQFGTEYVSQMQPLLSLKRDLPADRSEFERIRQELARAELPPFGRRVLARAA